MYALTHTHKIYMLLPSCSQGNPAKKRSVEHRLYAPRVYRFFIVVNAAGLLFVVSWASTLLLLLAAAVVWW